jgi:hypothetical protein
VTNRIYSKFNISCIWGLKIMKPPPLNWLVSNILLHNIPTPAFCIHVNQASPHKDIRLTTTFNYLLMLTLALFKCNNAGTPTKEIESSHRPLHCICQNSSGAFHILPTFHMSQYHTKVQQKDIIWLYLLYTYVQTI